MALITRTCVIKWNGKIKEYYVNKGYTFTKVNDKFEVKVEDLTDGSHAKIDIKCDHCGIILKNITWKNYKKYTNNRSKYYCQKCATKLIARNKINKINLKNRKSFEQWCIENNRQDILDRWDYELNGCSPNEICCSTHTNYYFKCPQGLHESELKNINGFYNGQEGSMNCNQCNSFKQWCIDNNRKDVLERWDYELNNKKPNEIPYGTSKKYYFKCPKGLHKSELKQINSFVNGSEGSINCNQCNSFAQWGIDNVDKNFLEKYWDYEKNNKLNLNPWKISYGSNKKVFIKCQEKDYHGSYNITCHEFSFGIRCSYCGNFKIHPLDSLGKLLEDKHLLNIWSDKNKKSPYKYAPKANKKVWWKCPNEKHNDYYRSIGGSNFCEFRCPECQYSKGEKRIEEWLINNDFIKGKDYISQKEFESLIGLNKGLLSYDFYLPNNNLLIEYQGEFHDGSNGKYTKINLKKQQEHDRRKKEYANKNNIKLLEIWYWDYENIEKILENNILRRCKK